MPIPCRYYTYCRYFSIGISAIFFGCRYRYCRYWKMCQYADISDTDTSIGPSLMMMIMKTPEAEAGRWCAFQRRAPLVNFLAQRHYNIMLFRDIMTPHHAVTWHMTWWQSESAPVNPSETLKITFFQAGSLDLWPMNNPHIKFYVLTTYSLTVTALTNRQTGPILYPLLLAREE